MSRYASAKEFAKELDQAYVSRQSEFYAWRRDIHAHPELSNREFEAARKIGACLDANGIPYRNGVGGTGIVALIGGGSEPAIALRGDMDALEITERTGLEYASTIPGVMHACGHDFHAASVLAAGVTLNQFRDRLPGGVKLLFQPAEELGPVGGAAPMIRDGALQNPDVVSAYGVHIAPDIPLGTVLIGDGPASTGVDNFIITIKGKGGHAAYPYRTKDPMAMAAQAILGINTLVARTVDAADNAVVSIGMIRGGTRRNIIPDQVELHGTIRTLSADTRRDLRRRVENMVRHCCQAAEGDSDVAWSYSFDPTMNTPEFAARARRGVDWFLGEGSGVDNLPPPMAAEDFGKFLEKAPGAFMWVGVREKEEMNLHSAELSVSDQGLDYCVRALLGATLGHFFR